MTVKQVTIPRLIQRAQNKIASWFLDQLLVEPHLKEHKALIDVVDKHGKHKIEISIKVIS